jgi:hypothetical protein
VKKTFVIVALALFATACSKKQQTQPTTPEPGVTEPGGGGPEPGATGGTGYGGGGGETGTRSMTPEEEAEAMALLKQMKTEVCACKDLPCMEAVVQKVFPQLQKFQNTEPSDKFKQDADALGKEMEACASKLQQP